MPTFKKCGEDVLRMAAGILCEFPSHKPVLDARVRVDYVFAYCDRDDHGEPKNNAIMFRGARALGLCRKIKLKDRVLGRGDAEITLDGDWWDTANEKEQRALLDHELHHVSIEVDSNGKAVTDDFTRPKVVLRKHDFEFGWFAIIAARHGKASQEVVQATQMMEEGGQYFWPEFYKPKPGLVAEDEEVTACIEVIKIEQRASVSLFQRRLRLGYTRASQIMDELEQRGIVGPAKGAEPRDILIAL